MHLSSKQASSQGFGRRRRVGQVPGAGRRRAWPAVATPRTAEATPLPARPLPGAPPTPARALPRRAGSARSSVVLRGPGLGARGAPAVHIAWTGAGAGPGRTRDGAAAAPGAPRSSAEGVAAREDRLAGEGAEGTAWPRGASRWVGATRLLGSRGSRAGCEGVMEGVLASGLTPRHPAHTPACLPQGSHLEFLSFSLSLQLPREQLPRWPWEAPLGFWGGGGRGHADRRTDRWTDGHPPAACSALHYLYPGCYCCCKETASVGVTCCCVCASRGDRSMCQCLHGCDFPYGGAWGVL